MFGSFLVYCAKLEVCISFASMNSFTCQNTIDGFVVDDILVFPFDPIHIVNMLGFLDTHLGLFITKVRSKMGLLLCDFCVNPRRDISQDFITNGSAGFC